MGESSEETRGREFDFQIDEKAGEIAKRFV